MVTAGLPQLQRLDLMGTAIASCKARFKRAPRRKKGLVTLSIDAHELLDELASEGSGQTLIVGGWPTYRRLTLSLTGSHRRKCCQASMGHSGGRTLKSVLPIAPSSSRCTFVGRPLRPCTIGTRSSPRQQACHWRQFSEWNLRVKRGTEVHIYSLADCHAFAHNNWEASLATKH